MDQIQAMKIFIRIAELESFSRAAEDLDLPRATVSTTLKRLEQRLGVRLFLRTTRQVKITDEGKIYYQRCLQLLSALEEADTLFAHHKNQPAGTVRIDMPHSLARVMVIPALQAFYEHYPHITLSVSANDNSVNLLDQGVDCVIRAWPSEDENLQSRHLANLEQNHLRVSGVFREIWHPANACRSRHASGHWLLFRTSAAGIASGICH